MTGEEHYAESERALEAAAGRADPEATAELQRAQTHALLALAAATGHFGESREQLPVGQRISMR